MDTPSYAEENKKKPIEAKAIDESAATVSAEVAGADCLTVRFFSFSFAFDPSPSPSPSPSFSLLL
jgi:hypothetical protein